MTRLAAAFTHKVKLAAAFTYKTRRPPVAAFTYKEN